MAFFAELKRRRVGKVAIAYGAIAWAVTEASSVVVPALHLPEWLVTAIVVFLMVGFPVAMVLAWIFDVGPQGIERTEPIANAPPSAQVRLRMAYAAVVLLLMAGLGYLLYERGFGRAHANQPHDSIAVLPFTNLSGDASRDYFSDGMSEELLNLLARVPGLKVASRTSSFAFKGRNLDIREVGRELGVETVLEGSVRQAGNQVRITAQLIDAETGFHLWSATYDRKLEDIFQVQDEIAAAIVDNLRIELAPQEQELAVRDKAPTQNVEAYELYLQGRAIWKRRGEDNLRKAIDLYQRALGLDPGFARAHAALASAYVVLPGYTKEKDDERQLMPMAEAAARQALSIDPKIGEAHAVLAQLNAERGDLLDAESGFFFAISLEPNEPTPHHWYSLLLSRVGRMEQAVTQARRAQELDPTSAILAGNLAAMYLMTGLDEQALRYSTLAEDLGIGRQQAGVEARVAMRRGQWDAAARLVAAEDGMQPELRAYVPQYVEALADPAKRPALVEQMRAIDPAVVKQVNLMQAYIELGALDVVYPLVFESLAADPLAWLREWDFNFAWTPEGAAFRRDPRFAELAERVGMVDYWKQYGFPDGCRAGEDTAIVCS
jgi:TolB-like protein/Flp pilus assembly protein TadD